MDITEKACKQLMTTPNKYNLTTSTFLITE